MASKKKGDRIFIVALVIIIIILLATLSWTFIGVKKSIKTPSDLNKGGDKCAVQEGYDEKEWKEHMSHHPDQYKECL